MAEEEDLKLDVGLIADKAEEIKQVDELSFNPDTFEEIKREFKQFLDEIVGNQNLRAFKEQYYAKYQVLESSYAKEQKTLKQCKLKINEIWEKAQSVRSAVRMAMQEVDKIADLKKSVDEEQQKAASRKEEEKDRMAKIEMLKEEIADAQRRANEAQELEEETILRARNKEWEELMKKKEEQDEKLMAKNTEEVRLLRQLEQSNETIRSQKATLDKLNAAITKAKEDQEQANNEKSKLDLKTQSLQQEKDMETAAIETLEREKEQGKADLAAADAKCNETANNLIKTKEE